MLRRGRARSVGPVVIGAFVRLLAGAMLPGPGDRPLGGMAPFALNVLLPLFAGPWLALQVRRRHWTPRQEWWGLVGTFAAAVLSLAAFDEWGAEPMKQRIAEATGTVDASGQRKKVVIALGMTISTPGDAASAPPSRQPPSPKTRTMARAALASGC